MAPPDPRRPFKRLPISDQQKRRELALLRQAQSRRDSQHHARCIASSVLSLQNREESQLEIEIEEAEPELSPKPSSSNSRDFDVLRSSKLRGPEVRQWFARQLMLPEWMVDVPPRLNSDWYVFARPAGKRCLLVSSNGTTVSRLRNGSILHHFPSALPNGARTKDISGPAHSFSILDCIFHEPDQTYYVIDMLCWRGYSLYDCSAEFRFFWLNSKLAETGACNPPSQYHRYRFTPVLIYECDHIGLHEAYTGAFPYTKDGLSFYNRHAHYQTGNTPLALVWKDENCSQYVLDTDNKGQVPAQQQVVLELQDDGKLTTSDDPRVVCGCLDSNFMQQSGLQSGSLLRFVVGEGGFRFVDGKLEMADIHYIGKTNRARAFADSYSKILFQYTARRSPLKIDDLVASISSCHSQEDGSPDVKMVL
ncbi:snurportin-1 isoform X2 [Macadamia integrifolia]|uniref:snurportin-1 isoform X2 n=1 Tax=Macadamia integrifolia TaxID=60698 RepID=UPI001C4F8B6A|nr:snurportin-1 isoform X2 [Macadamia integrifolia]